MIATLAAAAGLKLYEAIHRSYEQLRLEAKAQARQRAATMMQFMVACQGDEDSWKNQQRELLKIIREK